MKLSRLFQQSIPPILIISMVFQLMPGLAWADETPVLGTVAITDINQEQNKTIIAFQPLPEGISVTARVDSQGKGDYLTIQSALAAVKNGVIAISSGRYSEHDLIVPSGVILRGSYDSRTWQAGSEPTVIFGLPGKTSMVLSNGSAVQSLHFEQGGTALRVARGAATISRTVIMEADIAIAANPHTDLRLSNSALVNNKKAISGGATNRMFLYNTIFQDNTQLLTQSVDPISISKNNVFFPNQTGLESLQNQGSTTATTKPLPKAGWLFPPQTGNRNQTFNFEGKNDEAPTTISGPTLEIANGINAIQLYYQINSGDTLKILDRQHFSTTVYQSPPEGGIFDGWIKIPESNHVTLLLDTNGDNALPVQIGVKQTAKIPESQFDSTTIRADQGIFGRSEEADIFYRSPAEQISDKKLSAAELAKINAITKDVILAGEDWLSGAVTDTSSLFQLVNFKGFISQILVNSNNQPASENLEQTPKISNQDTRALVLLSDYLHFDQAFPLEEACTSMTLCPFSTYGLRSFQPTSSYELRGSGRSAGDGVTNLAGLFTTLGWTNGTSQEAQLKVDFSQPLTQGNVIWSQQIVTTTSGHLLTLTADLEHNSRNTISLDVAASGDLHITAWDKHGIRQQSTSTARFENGREYRFILSFDGQKVQLTRDDGETLWRSENWTVSGLQYFISGKSISREFETSITTIVSNLTTWADSAIHKVFVSTTNTLSGSLGENEHSIGGSVFFSMENICQANSISLSNAERPLATISGTITGSNCLLTLASPLTPSAQTTVPLAQINNQNLQLIWQTNPYSSLTTFSVISEQNQILSTLGYFGSRPIAEPVVVDNAQVQFASAPTKSELHYLLEPQITVQNLLRLVPVQRYEVVYGTDESSVRSGQANVRLITVEDLRRGPVPEISITNLQPHLRYYFAVRAVLENGTTTNTSATRDWEVLESTTPNLEAGTINQTIITGSLALGANGYWQSYAAGDSTQSTVVSGNTIQGRLGDPLALTSDASQLTAWSLGRDIGISTAERSKHIYTFPGEYIVTALRELDNNTILKQFGLVTIGHQSSDQLQISTETWQSTTRDRTWTSKATGKKITAIVGVNEPIYILGQALDVSGSAANAYTWNYKVDFGDTTVLEDESVKKAFNLTRRVGNVSEQTPLLHRYAQPGIYTIVSEVRDSAGHFGAFENTVIVTNPEVFPQQLESAIGTNQQMTVSGGTAPYTIRMVNNDEITMAAAGTISIPMTANGTITVRDSLGAQTNVAVITDSGKNVTPIYLPADRTLEVSPAQAKTNDTVAISSNGESHLARQTLMSTYFFGDVLPPYLVETLPRLQSPLTFSMTPVNTTDPTQSMGRFPAVISSIDNQGEEAKRAFQISVKGARFSADASNGIITGSIAPSFHGIHQSVEIWQRGSADVLLASVTPN
ncbi:hypothetical protein KA517_03760, partial [Candidatus Gracilibacteria bacterium]|nr:hypothetical protein [Candidatus Gracilibacteria bacterium]